MQVAGSSGWEQRADQPETMNKCAGRLHPRLGSNIRSCNTKFLRVGPVVRDVCSRLVAHHLDGRAGAAVGIGRIDAVVSTVFGLCDEAVHLAAVDVRDRTLRIVRPAQVELRRVVVGPDTSPMSRVGDTDAGGDSVGTGKGAEVLIKRPVLLHDHDNVLNLANACQPWRRRRTHRNHSEQERDPCQYERRAASHAALGPNT